MILPLFGLLFGVLAGLVLNVNVSYELSRYSAVAILAALDSVLGAVRAELDGVYDNRIFISGFVTNAVVAVLLGWWLLDEAVTWRFLTGGVTVLVGLLLVYLARVREARPCRQAPVEG